MSRFSLIVSVLSHRMGSSKYSTTGKNIQLHYASKHLMCSSRKKSIPLHATLWKVTEIPRRRGLKSHNFRSEVWSLTFHGGSMDIFWNYTIRYYLFLVFRVKLQLLVKYYAFCILLPLLRFHINFIGLKFSFRKI